MRAVSNPRLCISAETRFVRAQVPVKLDRQREERHKPWGREGGGGLFGSQRNSHYNSLDATSS